MNTHFVTIIVIYLASAQIYDHSKIMRELSTLESDFLSPSQYKVEKDPRPTTKKLSNASIDDLEQKYFDNVSNKRAAPQKKKSRRPRER